MEDKTPAKKKAPAKKAAAKKAPAKTKAAEATPKAPETGNVIRVNDVKKCGLREAMLRWFKR